jgi:methionine sulfoxide reductase heme-binding subunit
VHVALASTIVGITVGAYVDKQGDVGAAALEATQMFGLAALAAVLASASIGPLTSVAPRLPAKAEVLFARRAVGVAACVLVALHAALYLVPALARGGGELLEPEWSWPTGLALGLAAAAALLALAVTSRDAAVRSMGFERWKRLHRLVYAAIPLGFVHAVVVGSDFGLRPALRGVEGDAGCLVGFAIATAAWASLVFARRRARQK